MLDIAFIRQNADVVRAAITNKRVDLNLDDLLGADKDRRELIAKIEQKRARKNEIAALIPKASKDERPGLIDEGKSVKTELEQLEPALTQAQKSFDELILRDRMDEQGEPWDDVMDERLEDICLGHPSRPQFRPLHP